MKKLSALCLTVFLCLCCLASCSNGHKENTWFSEKKLAQCLVDELPDVDKDYVNKNDEDIYAYLTDSEFESYARAVYDYLRSREYKYLGTRGEQKNTFAGVFTTYYFQPADYLSEFYVDGVYIFVLSDGTLDENDNVVFNILAIHSVSLCTLEYGNKEFTYNTMISLRKGSETALSGFYELPDEGEHKHITSEWQYDENVHWRVTTCTLQICDSDILEEAHYDEDKNSLCDSCGYQMPELPTPTNHFLRNQAGCEWLTEITAEDIVEVKIIDEAVGVAPGAFKNISTTFDETVIARIFEDYYWLDTAPIANEYGQTDGGGSVTVYFILKDGTEKEININNGNYRDTEGNYFELLYTPKLEDTDDYVTSYGFITYQAEGRIYDVNDNLICSIPMDEIEFSELSR